MTIVRFTKRARADLVLLHSYIAADNPRAADELLRQLQKGIGRLEANPGVGRARPGQGPGDYRYLVVGRHSVVHTREPGGTVLIQRVLGPGQTLRGPEET
jgi:plasmid stabilization system protein ParE